MMTDEFLNASTRERTPRENLEANFLATRVSFTWLGVRRALDADQTAQAAESFGAEGQFLSAAKKLLDTKAPAYRAVSKVKSRATSYWKSISLPFPEPGLRLIRQDDLDDFEDRMSRFRGNLDAAVEELNDRYSFLRENARERLGTLFRSSDYPDSLIGAFRVEWGLVNVSPPDYLLTLRPDLYEREAARIKAQFDQAVAMAEQAFTEEFGKLVSHLTERLTGAQDGRPKEFKDSTVDNLKEFFDRFSKLSVRSNDSLEELVGQAQKLVQGVSPEALRNYEALRGFVGAEMGKIQASVDTMMQDRPRRSVIRRPR